MKLHWRPSKTTDDCRRVQQTLAEQGPTALRNNATAQGHLEECSDCFAVLESLTALDAGFEAMPRLDAPDELVESLLERIALEPVPEASELQPSIATHSVKRSWVETMGSGLKQLFGPGRPKLKAAAAFVLLAVISMPFYLQLGSRGPTEPITNHNIKVGLLEPRQGARIASQQTAGAAGEKKADAMPPEGSEQTKEQLKALGYVSGRLRKLDEMKAPEASAIQPTAAGDPAFFSTYRQEPPSVESEDSIADMRAKDSEILDRDNAGAGDNLLVWVGTDANITFRGGSPRIESDASGPFVEDTDARQRVRDRLRERLRSLPRGLQDAEHDPKEGAELDEDEETPADSKAGGFLPPEAGELNVPDEDSARELAQQFLTARDAVDAASRPATGYWTNTYVPGDPVLRYLQTRLAGHDHSQLAIPGAEPPRLHDGARRTSQPFDPPRGAALVVQLQSDRSAILGETRMLVQVGLTGTPRHGGRRPSMNVSVVLDLRGEILAETGASLVALAAAFAEAQDLGDRFRLFAAGRGDGEVLPAEDFGRGSAVVTTSRLLTDEGVDESPSLVEALHLAITSAAGDDDPNAPLGSSAVVLATSRRLATDTEFLAALAHQSAVAGIPVSVVGVGDAVELTELDQLALAGQGSRRLLRVPAQARGLVDRELAAAGRAVARAVRLQISLAPGVRLVDVVGARRHDEAGAEQVRQAEHALDGRLARNLGIKADRGEDEAGIQIVIPTFYAGDHHVVLLDVITPGPGPVADVAVRFKDLVQLENATARAQLNLPRGESGRGPLEHNVIHNLLAHRMRDVLEDAGRHVALDERRTAAELLAEHRTLLAGLRLEIAGLGRDPDLGRDIAMLDEYVGLLGEEWSETPERRHYLADSLRYAARLKVLPAPTPVGGAE